VTAGNLLAIVIGSNRGTSPATVSGVSDTHNTWHQISGIAGSNSTKAGDMWWTYLATGGSLTVTVTFSTTVDSAVTLIEVSGAGSAPTVDASVSASGSSTAPATGNTPATGQANDFVIAGLINALSGTPSSPTFSPTLTSTTTETRSGNASSPAVYTAAYDGISGASGNAQSFSATMSSGSWIAMIACFNAGSVTVLPVHRPTIISQAVQRAAIW
jgi:hypothetical protein